MKKKILSLLLTACLMFTLTLSVYASNEIVHFSSHGEYMNFTLDNGDMDYMDLTDIEIDGDNHLTVSIVADQPDANYFIHIFEKPENGPVDLQKPISYVNLVGSKSYNFRNVFEQGKDYRIYITSVSSSTITGNLIATTY
ncbi:hypothetical protein [Wukongibacter sp. M2B1]|uniref:hypothetical protein n=1 Tax=Wukongibacter sp. M2B1 TaxID=3088895 RepID=UPI003D7A7C20